MSPPRGTLFLIVGPSGAGKDTLLAGARAALAGDRRFHFARRVVTRPAGAEGEAHYAASWAQFAALRDRGDLLLHWEAHGLGYGLPAPLGGRLLGGTHVVANVSRAVVAEAAERLPPIRVVEVTAPAALLAARLSGRGRERAAEIAARLARATAPLPEGVPAVTLVNDGAPEAAVARLVAALTGHL